MAGGRSKQSLKAEEQYKKLREVSKTIRGRQDGVPQEVSDESKRMYIHLCHRIIQICPKMANSRKVPKMLYEFYVRHCIAVQGNPKEKEEETVRAADTLEGLAQKVRDIRLRATLYHYTGELCCKAARAAAEGGDSEARRGSATRRCAPVAVTSAHADRARGMFQEAIACRGGMSDTHCSLAALLEQGGQHLAALNHLAHGSALASARQSPPGPVATARIVELAARASASRRAEGESFDTLLFAVLKGLGGAQQPKRKQQQQQAKAACDAPALAALCAALADPAAVKAARPRSVGQAAAVLSLLLKARLEPTDKPHRAQDVGELSQAIAALLEGLAGIVSDARSKVERLASQRCPGQDCTGWQSEGLTDNSSSSSSPTTPSAGMKPTEHPAVCPSPANGVVEATQYVAIVTCLLQYLRRHEAAWAAVCADRLPLVQSLYQASAAFLRVVCGFKTCTKPPAARLSSEYATFAMLGHLWASVSAEESKTRGSHEEMWLGRLLDLRDAVGLEAEAEEVAAGAAAQRPLAGGAESAPTTDGSGYGDSDSSSDDDEQVVAQVHHFEVERRFLLAEEEAEPESPSTFPAASESEDDGGVEGCPPPRDAPSPTLAPLTSFGDSFFTEQHAEFSQFGLPGSCAAAADTEASICMSSPPPHSPLRLCLSAPVAVPCYPSSRCPETMQLQQRLHGQAA